MDLILLWGLQGFVSFGCFVIFILVLIKQFSDSEHGGILHGVVGIITGSLWTLIWGWRHREKHYLKNLMLIWTIGIVLNIVLTALAFRVLLAAAKEQLG